MVLTEAELLLKERVDLRPPFGWKDLDLLVRGEPINCLQHYYSPFAASVHWTSRQTVTQFSSMQWTDLVVD